MASVDDPKIVEQVILSRGGEPLIKITGNDEEKNRPDPPVIAVYQYENRSSGKTAYSLIFATVDVSALFSSPFAKNPVRLWSKILGTTKEGEQFLARMRQQAQRAS